MRPDVTTLIHIIVTFAGFHLLTTAISVFTSAAVGAVPLVGGDSISVHVGGSGPGNRTPARDHSPCSGGSPLFASNRQPCGSDVMTSRDRAGSDVSGSSVNAR